ncbi:MAG: hypothetical protein Kow002_01820 [Anaerolineales bacterium]
MNQNTYYAEQPGLVKTVAILTLINGIVNIFWGLVATATVTASIVLICLAPFAILPTVLGVFEIIYALKLLSNPPQPVHPSNAIAILEILCVLTGNVFSMVVGILALVFYNDAQVKAYFAQLNGIPYPVAETAPVPLASPPVIEPAPAIEAESPAEAPAPEESKSKKPRKRQVAKKDESASKTEAGKKSGKDAKKG